MDQSGAVLEPEYRALPFPGFANQSIFKNEFKEIVGN